MHVIASIRGKRIEISESYLEIEGVRLGHEDVTGLRWGVGTVETWFGLGSERAVDKIGIRAFGDEDFHSTETLEGIGTGRGKPAEASGCRSVTFELACRAAFPP